MSEKTPCEPEYKLCSGCAINGLNSDIGSANSCIFGARTLVEEEVDMNTRDLDHVRAEHNLGAFSLSEVDASLSCAILHLKKICDTDLSNLTGE